MIDNGVSNGNDFPFLRKSAFVILNAVSNNFFPSFFFWGGGGFVTYIPICLYLC